MARRYYECIVCGKKFPEGQGIIIYKAGVPLYFHSSKCAARFLKVLVENLDDSCAKPAIEETVRSFKEALEARREKTRKVI